MEGTFREPLSSSSRGGGRKRPGHKLPKTTETPVLRQGALYAASTRWDGTARRAGEDQRALQEAAWVVGGRVRFPPRRPLRSYGTGVARAAYDAEGGRDRWMRKGAQRCAPTNGKRPGGPGAPALQ